MRFVLQTLRIPGLWLLMRDWTRLMRMHFLHAAFESGLLQALQTGASRKELITTLGVQRPEILDALLDLGLALKELALRKTIYTLKGKRSKVLAMRQGDALAAVVQASITYYNAAYRHLPERMRGAPLGDDLCEIGEIVARFSKISKPILNGYVKSLVPASGPFRILDVGCGSGFVLKTVSESNKTASGIGIDVDAKVVMQAKRNLDKWGLHDQFDILTGDINSHGNTLQGGFDLITAFNLIYYLPLNERLKLFTLLRSLLSDGGCLCLVNNFQSKGRDPAAANLNIVNCSLKNLTALPSLSQIKSLLTDCGFNRIRSTRFMPGSEFYGMLAYV
jgi:SAM-dependent methyltransferase